MRILTFVVSILLISQFCFAANVLDLSIQQLETIPLAFTKNQGQWDEQVSFRAKAGGATMWFTHSGAVYQFTRSIPKDVAGIDDPNDPLDHFGDSEPDRIESIAIKASFVGANLNPHIAGFEMIEYKCNYFIGSDQTRWHTDVPNYSAIVYEEVYDGIDLKYYGNGKQMEYDFIVSPGADPSQIVIQYEGAESIFINDRGELVVETKWGKVIEQRPIIYQMSNNSRIEVSGEYSLKGASAFGFKLGSNYDPALPVVIDPVLSYSTYLGGNNDDRGYDIAVDGLGNSYITGRATSSDFPIEGEYQTNQGSYDVFITKLNNSGNGLVFSTYLGGSSYDYGFGIAIDGSGNVYVTGRVSSTDFPTIAAFQATYQGGLSDAFVAKLNNSGNDLVYSTYLGGSIDDYAISIAVDEFGSAYITGSTFSLDFPIENEYQTVQTNGDIFVTKLNSSGGGLDYSTYLGGSSGDHSYGIAVDEFGSAFVTGITYSTDFPTEGSFQDTYQGGFYDAFVTKFNSSGNGLVYSTYLGGSSYDYAKGIALDDFGSAYIIGYTGSTDFPIEGAYQADQSYDDVFVTKLNSSGDGLVYSTYLGGNSDDWGQGIAVDEFGSAYITGYTLSTDLPTVGEYQTNQDTTDAFVAKLNESGDGLVYCTYLGGSANDYGSAIAVDDFGSAYVTGTTYSDDFPTINEYQTNQDYNEAFVVKFRGLSNCGDANGDELANVGDAVFLINFVFKGGAAPVPNDAGDANCDLTTNVGDAVYLINFVFKDGAAPCATCQ